MPISAFEYLRFPPELACEFFSVFSRFEFALKESGYRRAGRNENAEPDWDRFATEISPGFENIEIGEIAEAMNYLTGRPPYRQVILPNDTLDWEQLTFRDGMSTAGKVLLAVRTVRNNLFHGGKHTAHSPPGRDEELIRAALRALYYCLERSEVVKRAYEAAVS